MSNVLHSLPSILKYGFSVAVVGIATVFVGLIILIALIKVIEITIRWLTKKQGKTEEAPAVAPAPIEATVEEEKDDAELIAVIAAAVAAAMEAEGETDGFVVRSIRRINNAPAWNRAGREEQVCSRL